MLVVVVVVLVVGVVGPPANRRCPAERSPASGPAADPAAAGGDRERSERCRPGQSGPERRSRLGPYASVTAPCSAPVANRAYLAKTPEV